MSVQDFENARWEDKRQSTQFRHHAALSLIQGGPVLDIGCGDGLFLSMCKDKGIEAQGVDFSNVAVSHCKEQGLKAQQVDITAGALPFSNKGFPVVVALDVLEHVYDPQELLQEMKRISSRNIIIGVPNFSSLPARLQTLFGSVPENNRPHKGHIYWFNWSVLRSLIEKNGLHIVALRVNAPWERIPLIGSVTRALANLFPNLFALSFVVQSTAN
jgi:methionine biosynthesis protein MetW